MEYINTAKIKKLVAVNREKRFIDPGEIVGLSPIDVSMLGANAVFMRPAHEVNIRKIQKSVVKSEEKEAANKEAAEKKVKEDKKKAASKKKADKEKAADKKKADAKKKKDESEDSE